MPNRKVDYEELARDVERHFILRESFYFTLSNILKKHNISRQGAVKALKQLYGDNFMQSLKKKAASSKGQISKEIIDNTLKASNL